MANQNKNHELDMDFLPAEVLAMLDEDLSPELIASYDGAGGKTLQYIEAHTAISNANRIFKPANWGPRVLSGPTLNEIEHTDSRTGEVSRHQYYTAIVAVYVYGRFISSDEGFGEVDEIKPGTLSKMMLGMHEKARKGAISDGIKRALRILGKQFGNSLYADSDNGTDTYDPTAPACPIHGPGRHIRESSFGDGYYCTRKDASTESGYCDRTPVVPSQEPPQTREEAAARMDYEQQRQRQQGQRQRQEPQRQMQPQGWGNDDDWGYVNPTDQARQPVGTAPPNGAAEAGAQRNGGHRNVGPPSGAANSGYSKAQREEMVERYVRVGAKVGLDRGKVFTNFYKKFGKPITQASDNELQKAVRDAEAIGA